MKTTQILTALFVSVAILQTASSGPDKVYEPVHGVEIISDFAASNDTFGLSSEQIRQKGRQFVMIREYSDGSAIAGLYNRGETAAEVTVEFAELGLAGKKPVRDLCRQKYLGRYRDRFSAIVPAQGVVMVKVGR